MADLIVDDKNSYCKRLQCDCLDPTHTVDFHIEYYKDGKSIFDVEFVERYYGNQMPLLLRIKRAIKLLLGKPIWGHSFIIRRDDIAEMIELLERAKQQYLKEER